MKMAKQCYDLWVYYRGYPNDDLYAQVEKILNKKCEGSGCFVGAKIPESDMSFHFPTKEKANEAQEKLREKYTKRKLKIEISKCEEC
jgi:hypothetical protein